MDQDETATTHANWVDPRLNPKPPAPPPRWMPVADPQEIADLLAFCKGGRIYEIERWIMAGKPLQATKYEVYRRGRLESPIEIAISKGATLEILLIGAHVAGRHLDEP